MKLLVGIIRIIIRINVRKIKRLKSLLKYFFLKDTYKLKLNVTNIQNIFISTVQSMLSLRLLFLDRAYRKQH